MVELYRRACSLRLHRESSRVYARRFHIAAFDSQGGGERRAFLELWCKVEQLGSADEVKRATGRSQKICCAAIRER